MTHYTDPIANLSRASRADGVRVLNATGLEAV